VALAFSSDGQTLASGSYDKTVIVWDVVTGHMRWLFRPETWAWVSSLVLSADSTTLVSDSGHVWNLLNGRLLRRSYRYGSPVTGSSDGQMLACSSLMRGVDTFSLLVTTLHTGRTLHRFAWYREEPYSIAFSSDGSLLAAASYDGQEETKHLYITATIDLKTGERRIIGYDQRVCLFGVEMGSGVRLVAVSPDGSQLWNAETGDELRTAIAPDPRHSPNEMLCVCLSPDGRLLANGTDRGVVSVWNVATSQRLWQQQAHQGWLREIAITRDGRTLATASDDHTLRLWDAWSGTPGRTLGGRGASVEAVAFDPNGQAITALSADGTARLWRIAPPACERRETLPGLLAQSAPRTPDTARNLWSVPEVTLPADPDLPTGDKVVVISPDGSLIAMRQPDGDLALWDRNQRLLLTRLPSDEGWATPAFSPNNRLLAMTSDRSRTVRIFHTHTGEIRRSLALEDDCGSEAVELAFSPDSRLLAVGHIGFAVTLWSVQTGKRKRLLRLPGDSVSALAFAPKGDVLAVGTDYEEIAWLRRLTRWGKSVQLIGHTNSIRSSDFSPDGTRIVTAAQDATVRLWETESGRLLATFLALPGEDWIIYTPQGDYTGSPGVERYLLRQVGADLVPVEPDLLSHRPFTL
jgi:WD40 repeat protein